eukprot:jgi/Bigna1/132590/aug1.18_g7298
MGDSLADENPSEEAVGADPEDDDSDPNLKLPEDEEEGGEAEEAGAYPDKKRARRGEGEGEGEEGQGNLEEILDDIPDYDFDSPAVRLKSIQVLENPSLLLKPLRFEITLETQEKGLKDDLRWNVVWVGSASDKSLDQELEDVDVGPIKGGISRFILETPPPDPKRIPAEDRLGATVLLLTCSYRGNRFLKIGYYVNVCETREEAIDDDGDTGNNRTNLVIPDGARDGFTSRPESTDPATFWRSLLSDEPRIYQYPIVWDDPVSLEGLGSQLHNSDNVLYSTQNISSADTPADNHTSDTISKDNQNAVAAAANRLLNDTIAGV